MYDSEMLIDLTDSDREPFQTRRWDSESSGTISQGPECE